MKRSRPTNKHQITLTNVGDRGRQAGHETPLIPVKLLRGRRLVLAAAARDGVEGGTGDRHVESAALLQHGGEVGPLVGGGVVGADAVQALATIKSACEGKK